MPQHPNNDLYRFPQEKKKGLIGTILIHTFVIGSLFILGMYAPVIEPEEGILVNFGFDDTGYGDVEPSIAMATPEDYSPPLTSSTNMETVDEEPLLTQDFEEAPEVKEVDPQAEIRRQQEIEAERIRQEELEAERIRKEQEEIERQRILEEERRQAEITDRTRNALTSAQNRGTTSTSEGVAGGTGNQGSPTGSVESTNRGEGAGLGNSGVSYDLGGRGVRTLPLPDYDYQGEGRVVVEVRVDRTGRVIQATPGKQGTTTYEEYLHNAAREAALKTVFEADPNAASTQIGTIIYNFKLN